jgi:N-acetylglucosaminyldiphosphoundecaprenol N-acetyl-beta-D-mannosaminyltransferase
MEAEKIVDEKAFVAGISVSCTTFSNVLMEMAKKIKSRSTRHYISITNTESMYHALRVKEHLRYINNADFSLCDGIGSVIAGKFWGHDVPRLNGPILMLEACGYGQKLGWRHYFYGGKEGVADTMVEKLQQRYPELISAGTYCPPFRPLTDDEDSQVIQRINDAKPDIVWVGLGLLKQEKWIADHFRKIDAPWMCGEGAAFDYHSGAVPWAPPWIQRIGMEWLFRTFIQPKQRIRRYVWSFIFLFEAIFMGLQARNKKITER